MQPDSILDSFTFRTNIRDRLENHYILFECPVSLPFPSLCVLSLYNVSQHTNTIERPGKKITMNSVVKWIENKTNVTTNTQEIKKKDDKVSAFRLCNNFHIDIDNKFPNSFPKCTHTQQFEYFWIMLEKVCVDKSRDTSFSLSTLLCSTLWMQAKQKKNPPHSSSSSYHIIQKL